ncbi:hypothetical protein NEOLI_001546, partial [Neolecta irregularis DAH-3]
KKRKLPVEHSDTALPRIASKRIKHLSKSSSIPVAPLPKARPPAPAPLIPINPFTSRSLTFLSPGELVKLTRQNTTQNRLYNCDFDRVVIRKKEARPPSPNPKVTARAAAEARAQRKLRELELGYATGPGDDDTWGPPPQITPTRKAVKWGLKLEEEDDVKLSDPAQAIIKRPEKGCLIIKAKLNEFGNVIDHKDDPSPTKPFKVTVQKILYRGERDD